MKTISLTNEELAILGALLAFGEENWMEFTSLYSEKGNPGNPDDHYSELMNKIYN